MLGNVQKLYNNENTVWWCLSIVCEETTMQSISDRGHSGLSWGAVLVGAMSAQALYLVLLMPGLGSGMPVISPWSNTFSGGSSATLNTTAAVADRGSQASTLYLDSLLAGTSERTADAEIDGEAHADLWSFLFQDLIAGTLSAHDYGHAMHLAASQTDLGRQALVTKVTIIVDEARQDALDAERQARNAARAQSIYAVLTLLVALVCGSLVAGVMITLSDRPRTPVSGQTEGVAGQHIDARKRLCRV